MIDLGHDVSGLIDKPQRRPVVVPDPGENVPLQDDPYLATRWDFPQGT